MIFEATPVRTDSHLQNMAFSKVGCLSASPMAQLHVVKISLGNQVRMIAVAYLEGLAAHLGTGITKFFPCSTECPITQGQVPSAEGLRAFPMLCLVTWMAECAPEAQDTQFKTQKLKVASPFLEEEL